MKGYVSVLILLIGYVLAAPLASAQAKPQRVRVAPQIAADLLKKRVPPEYPHEAKEKHLEGSVEVRPDLLLNAGGTPFDHADFRLALFASERRKLEFPA